MFPEPLVGDGEPGGPVDVDEALPTIAHDDIPPAFYQETDLAGKRDLWRLSPRRGRGYPGVLDSPFVSSDDFFADILVFDNMVDQMTPAHFSGMTVTVIKDADDWFWVMANLQHAQRPGSWQSSWGMIFDHHDTLCWQCDQLQGLLGLLGSDEFATLVKQWPGNYSEKKGRE